MTTQADQTIKLFYSYSHRDTRYRQAMETSLALLKSQGLLKDWSDSAILPGQNISAEVRANMGSADIIAFLVSPDFIESTECMKEWKYASQLAEDHSLLVRIPIIVRDCAWLDLLGDDDIKALPDDGVPVATFGSQDTAWLQVYEGVKSVIQELRNTFTLRSQSQADMERTDFISEEHIKLQDLFMFLPLICRGFQNDDLNTPETIITEQSELLDKKYVLIHGSDRSGKTALGRHVFLTLAEELKPVLHVDLSETRPQASEHLFRELYQSQFHGDYSLWREKADKTLVVDNLTGHPSSVDFLVEAMEVFDRIIVTTPTTVFHSFYMDESRLADFEELQIAPLTQIQQEDLIRRRLSLTSGNARMSDGDIDKIEDRVNSIIIDDRVVPRYPFFVLCILQTYEGYMPSGMAITSYGHCYYALIVASLVRAGISQQDTDINTCFNFAEHLAHQTYMHATKQTEPFSFEQFVQKYREEFIVPNSIINRLKHEEFGLLDSEGQFRTPYMYYFFLGRFLSKNTLDSRSTIERMCDATHVPSNYLTLLFTIHHTSDLETIDEILLRTMCTLDEVEPAKLDRDETRRFREIVSALPENILSDSSVAEERQREREFRDEAAVNLEDPEERTEDGDPEVQEAVNGIYRVLKNNEIIGQILRNKYGSMTIKKIEETIEIMADGGLRLVNLILKDEAEILEMAHYIKTKHPEYDVQDIRQDLRRFSFLWTMINVEHIVDAMNVREIRPAIDRVVGRMDTPAFDVIGYFTHLDGAPKITEEIRDDLVSLLRRHRDPFVKGVLSIRTQHYMNTHRSQATLEQSISASLGIKYLPRVVPRR